MAVAGPTSTKDASFHFEIPGDVLSSDGWRLYFISVGDFENDNWSFSQYRNRLENDYIDFKARCGVDGTFREIIYEMSAEERAHKGCTINGTYQEVYCFKASTDIPSCERLLPDKIDDAYRLDYKSYYDSSLWDIGRAEFYRHHALASCDIVDSECVFTIDRGAYPYNPFIVVAERLNSSEDIYFSTPMNISGMEVFSDDSLFSCGASYYCDVHVNVTLTLQAFEALPNNALRVRFDSDWSFSNLRAQPAGDASVKPEGLGGLFGRFLRWWRSLF